MAWRRGRFEDAKSDVLVGDWVYWDPDGVRLGAGLGPPAGYPNHLCLTCWELAPHPSPTLPLVIRRKSTYAHYASHRNRSNMRIHRTICGRFYFPPE